ncbi:uncharacterized protein BT62DRAFT_191236 [Guyanagaster necrorhizus]|uniref:Uncharacterized protein n=1 Tax=Guyanagaster necrorhizus TaxID=856835 RepID=A0A9P7VSW6_9AGAR|nr:uncharacterized protein BT62DRAFT_191236 [Guyanagaster necrorhizus MCA 3950]KAG7445361.1 hypothetical protein BT62DRAFT_191236 [Guyanagaster necrorhizus MCA 3950]
MNISPSGRAPSPLGFYGRVGSDGTPYVYSSPSLPSGDFQIERSIRSPYRPHTVAPALHQGYEEELIYRDHISRLLTAKTRVFSISGRIPLDPSQLVLFFRTKSGITHSLDFPIDVDYNTPPALDVLIAACRPHQTSDIDSYAEHESLFFPPNLPLTTSLEIANHPILAAIRTTLFPSLPEGQYLTTRRDRLEVIVSGGRMGPQSRSLRNDGRVATITVTLPVRFRGGALIVRSDSTNAEERFTGKGGKNGDIEWTAFLADCDYEVEMVEKGCRLSILYGVYLKTFGTGVGVGVVAEPLVNPSDGFFDLLAPVLNMSRGRKVAFSLSHDYGVCPADVLAEYLVPYLKGGDSVLYNALRLYKLTPELHWTAGGYIWPIDHLVESLSEDISSPGLDIVRRGTPALRGAFSTYGDPELHGEVDNLRQRIASSGAIPLLEAEITILTDGNVQAVGKERVPFVSNGQLDKLVVNAVIVVYVP